MSRRCFASVLILALGVAFGGRATAARAADKGATGTWTWTNNSNGEDITTTLTLKQDHGKLTGKMKRLDFEGNIENGKVNRNGELSFTIPRERDGTKFVIKYTGKVDGDSLRIKGVVTLNGQEHAREFEARRVAD